MDRLTEWAPWVDPGPAAIATKHLPDEVVSQPFLVSLEMGTSESNPRVGGMYVSVNLGGRLNPALTEQEREYLVASFSAALAGLAQGSERKQDGDDTETVDEGTGPERPSKA